MPNNEIIKITFICKDCKEKIELFTRRPKLIRNRFCDSCLTKRNNERRRKKNK